MTSNVARCLRDRFGPALLGLGACLWLSACASEDGPGWANPVSWFSEDEVAFETLDNDKELSQDYPTLGAVPVAAPPVSTAEQRARLTRDLESDRAAARDGGSRLAQPSVAKGAHAPGSRPPAPYPAGLSTATTSTATASTATESTATMPMANSGREKIAVIYFQHGSSRLADSDRAVLADVAAIQAERQGRLHVVGHASNRAEETDPVAGRLANFAASVRRADAVAAELMRQGVAARWLEVSARGSDVPARGEDSAVGEASNRRAEIFLEM